MTQNPHFPISERFEDVYFSRENGMEESQHVFIEGASVRRLMQKKSSLVFCETGFGTGLNFLMLMNEIQQQNKLDKISYNIDYISFEKYPLNGDQIQSIHSFWANSFQKTLPS